MDDESRRSTARCEHSFRLNFSLHTSTKAETVNVMKTGRAKILPMGPLTSHIRMLDEPISQNITTNATDDGGHVLIPSDAESYFQNFIIWTLIVMAFLLVVAVALQCWNEKYSGFSLLNQSHQSSDLNDRESKSRLNKLNRGGHVSIDNNDISDREINNPSYSDTNDDDTLHDDRSPRTI